MIRALALVALVALVGCGSSPCDGVSGACLGVRVTRGPVIDDLRFTLSGAVTYTGNTKHAAHAPPIDVALQLTEAAMGVVHLGVEGLLDDVVRAHALVDVTIVAGERRTIDVALDDSTSPPDLDGGGVDHGVFDQGADLQPDLGPVDLGGVDLSANVRVIFVSETHAADVGDQAMADQLCASDAASAGLMSSSWQALLGYIPSDGGALGHVTVTHTNRPVVLPDGQVVWASDADVLNGNKSPMRGIDEQANGMHVGADCVWTGFGIGGNTVGTATRGTCDNWTNTMSDFDLGFAYAGKTAIGDAGAAWALATPQPCGGTCRVYCLGE